MFYLWNQNGTVSLKSIQTFLKGGFFVALFFAPTLTHAFSCQFRVGTLDGTISGSQGTSCSLMASYPNTVDTVMLSWATQADTGGQWTQTSGVCQYRIEFDQTYQQNIFMSCTTDPVCTEGSSLDLSFSSSAPAQYCDGHCSYDKTGGTVCVILGGQTLCGASYTSTTSSCTTATDNVSSSSCVDINGVQTCTDSANAGATDNCYEVGGQMICDGTVAYGDCYEVDGGQVCNSSGSPDNTSTTNNTPLDPTTGQTLNPDGTVTSSSSDGSSSTTNNVYSNGTLEAKSPYACDNPDTAQWEPCEGYCDNPYTTINECEDAYKCVDNPATKMYDESSLCSGAWGGDCGGIGQPGCDAYGNPITTDPATTTNDGSTITTDGAATLESINALGETLTKGWNQPSNAPKGNLPQSESDAAVAQVKLDYEAALETIRSEAASITTFQTGVGSLPCYRNWQIPSLGASITMCFSDYEEPLSILSTIMLLIGALVAAAIIFG